jgi:ATP-dependent Clp protease protease subunit
MKRRLLNLLASAAALATGQTTETIKVDFRAETNGDEASIYLYDVIDKYWGISAQNFVKALADIKASTIHLRINSPGGDVFEARAIKTALEQHSARVVVHIDGIAASAASFIMLAGEEIEMSRGAMVMVHNAWSFAVGNANDLRATADLLDKVDGQIANDYARKTGETVDAVKAWMTAETWFTEDEALEAKLIDRIYEKEAVENSFDLTVFDKTPEKLRAKTPAPENIDEAAQKLRARAYRRLELIERT